MTPHERLAAHEAGHCVAALLLGVPVVSVSVEPDSTSNGRLVAAYTESAEDARKRMLVILSGLIEEYDNTDNDLPAWPLTGHTTDERNLRALADRLGLTSHEYTGPPERISVSILG